jgi:hypothetical protein
MKYEILIKKEVLEVLTTDNGNLSVKTQGSASQI